MAPPNRNRSFRNTEIDEMAERLRTALGRKLTAEEQEFFRLAEQAYEADDRNRLVRPKAA